jgi:hypothetical protein
MFNTIAGARAAGAAGAGAAGATLRYGSGSGSDQMMRLWLRLRNTDQKYSIQ